MEIEEFIAKALSARADEDDREGLCLPALTSYAADLVASMIEKHRASPLTIDEVMSCVEDFESEVQEFLTQKIDSICVKSVTEQKYYEGFGVQGDTVTSIYDAKPKIFTAYSTESGHHRMKKVSLQEAEDLLETCQIYMYNHMGTIITYKIGEEHYYINPGYYVRLPNRAYNFLQSNVFDALKPLVYLCIDFEELLPKKEVAIFSDSLVAEAIINTHNPRHGVYNIDEIHEYLESALESAVDIRDVKDAIDSFDYNKQFRRVRNEQI